MTQENTEGKLSILGYRAGLRLPNAVSNPLYGGLRPEIPGILHCEKFRYFPKFYWHIHFEITRPTIQQRKYQKIFRLKNVQKYTVLVSIIGQEYDTNTFGNI